MTETLPDQHGDDGGSDPEGERRQRAGTRAGKAVVEWVVVIGAALVIALLIRTFLLQQYSIPSDSMVDTLVRGDRVFVNKLSYRLHDVRRGDVIVFERPPGQPDDGIKDLIKRVIGLPGESLTFHDCVVAVEGQVLQEPYIDGACTNPPGPDVDPDQDGTVVVPGDHVFVMGDNRPGSFDSRFFGPIEESSIVGRAFVVVWPVGHWAWL